MEVHFLEKNLLIYKPNLNLTRVEAHQFRL